MGEFYPSITLWVFAWQPHKAPKHLKCKPTFCLFKEGKIPSTKRFSVKSGEDRPSVQSYRFSLSLQPSALLSKPGALVRAVMFSTIVIFPLHSRWQRISSGMKSPKAATVCVYVAAAAGSLRTWRTSAGQQRGWRCLHCRPWKKLTGVSEVSSIQVLYTSTGGPHL